jgi:hypothetical protein
LQKKFPKFLSEKWQFFSAKKKKKSTGLGGLWAIVPKEFKKKG